MSIILVQPRFEHSLTLFGRAAITASLSCCLSSFAVSFASSMFFLLVQIHVNGLFTYSKLVYN